MASEPELRAGNKPTAADLVGTWRGAGQDLVAPDGTVTSSANDPAPAFIMYAPEGVMMVLSTVAHDVPRREVEALSIEEKAKLADATVAYYGRYDVNDGVVRHHLELGLFPIWSGQTRIRYATLDGRRLTFTTQPDKAGVVARIYWERITAG